MKDDNTYCSPCYASHCAPKCAKCGGAVMADGITVSDAVTYHNTCFVCAFPACGYVVWGAYIACWTRERR